MTTPTTSDTYAAMTASGYSVVVWGDNSLGQHNVPSGLSGIAAQVSAGHYHVAAVTDAGVVFAWGFNDYGQCDVPAGLVGVEKVSSGVFHTAALKTDGTVVAWGGNADSQCDVPGGLTDVIDISSGEYHTAALKSDGTMVVWGNNAFGQLSIPAGLSGVSKISSGSAHILALKSDGTVVAWGYNNFGQATVPITLVDVEDVSAGYFHSMALKTDGTVVAWGWNDDGQATVPGTLSSVSTISAGYRHSSASKSDGSVICWGWNGNGESTVPSGLLSSHQVSSGGAFTASLSDSTPTTTSTTTTTLPATTLPPDSPCIPEGGCGTVTKIICRAAAEYTFTSYTATTGRYQFNNSEATDILEYSDGTGTPGSTTPAGWYSLTKAEPVEETFLGGSVAAGITCWGCSNTPNLHVYSTGLQCASVRIQGYTGQTGCTAYSSYAEPTCSVILQAPAFTGKRLRDWTLVPQNHSYSLRSFLVFNMRGDQDAFASANYCARSLLTVDTLGAPRDLVVMSGTPSETGGNPPYGAFVNDGCQVSLVAPSVPGYCFVGWTGTAPCGCSVSTTCSTVSFTMGGDASVSAEYRNSAFTGTVYITSSGADREAQIQSTPSGYSGTTPYSSSVPFGETAILVAPSIPNYWFVGWAGDVPSTYYQPCSSLILPIGCSTLSVEAKYFRAYGDLYVVAPGMCGVGISSDTGHSGNTDYVVDTVAAGTAVSLSAPDLTSCGYRFTGWSKCSTNVCSSLDYSFSMPEAPWTELSVGYKLLRTVTVASCGASSVPVSAIPAYYSTTTDSTVLVEDGESVLFIAPEVQDYKFAGWTGDYSGTLPNAQVTVSSDISLVANYIPLADLACSLYVSSTGNGVESGVVVSGTAGHTGTTPYVSTDIISGTSVSLTAPAISGYRFDGWQMNGVSNSTLSTVSFQMPDTDVCANVAYTRLGSISIQSSGILQVPIVAVPSCLSGTTGYVAVPEYCSLVSFTAPSSMCGSNFVEWQIEPDATTCSSTTLIVCGAAERTLTAVFCNIKSDLCVLSNVASLSVTSPTGHGGTTDYTISSVSACSLVEIRAENCSGYRFVRWARASTLACSSALFKFIMPECQIAYCAEYEKVWNVSITACGTAELATITTVPSTYGGTSPYCAVVPDGLEVLFIAPSIYGYEFLGWGATPAVGGYDGCSATIRPTVTCAEALVPNYRRIANTVTVCSTGCATAGVTNTFDSQTAAPYLLCSVPLGNFVSFNAPTVAGYLFQGWTVCGAVPSISGSCATISMPAGSVSVSAGYLASYFLSVDSQGTSSPVSISSPYSGQGGTTPYCSTLPQGTIVQLNAPAVQYYDFSGWWSGGGLKTATARLDTTLSANCSYVACYTRRSTTVTVQSTGISPTTVTSTCSLFCGTTPYSFTANAGTSVTLTLPACSGWLAKSWTGLATSSNSSVSFVLDLPGTVTGNYLRQHSIQVQSTGKYNVPIGSTTGNSGTTNYQSTYTETIPFNLCAPDAPGAVFCGWSSSVFSGGFTSSRNINPVFSAPNTVAAVYQPITYTICASAPSLSSSIAVTGSAGPGFVGGAAVYCATVIPGGTFTLTVPCSVSGMSFLGWTGTGICGRLNQNPLDLSPVSADGSYQAIYSSKALYIGNCAVVDLYVGNCAVQEVWMGSTLVWKR